LTHSGRLTHEVVTRQPWIRRRSGKVRQLRTDVLTTEPRLYQSVYRSTSTQNRIKMHSKAAASTWNALPRSVRSSTSVLQFRSRLTTELFARSYQQSVYRSTSTQNQYLRHCYSLFLYRDLKDFGFLSR